jgi:tetratricopeptide (TPR) repeat protein/transglutaminase-like putative cysteine protease
VRSFIAAFSIACATVDPSVAEDELPPIGHAFAPSSRSTDVVVLSELGHYRFSPDGKKTYAYEIEYRIDGSIEGWSTISAEWSPWFQKRPAMSATVVTRDGRRYELDPTSAAEVPVSSESSDLFSDRRRLRAPLPGVETGATVSQRIVYEESRPFFEEGGVGVFFFGMRVPVERSVLVIDVPKGLPFRWLARAVDVEPEITEGGGLIRHTFAVAGVPPMRPVDRMLPSDVPRFPHIVFSTSRSWNALATRYGSIVEGRLEGADVSELVAGIPGALPRRTLIAALLARLHERIRYTGMEFGEQAIIPWKPNETIARKFGDCKDKAILLVAMLRHFRIDASLALLRSGASEDVMPELPGLEGFNHAIVYVPGEDPLWIDATAELAPVGGLPPGVEGRYALIAARSTTDVVRIPASGPTDNQYLELRDYYLADYGPMRIVERTEATGTMELELREKFTHASDAEIRDTLESYARSAYRAERLLRFEVAEARDVSIPFAMELEAENAGVGFTASADAFVQLRSGILFSFLPEVLRHAALAEDREAEVERLAAREMIEGRSDDLVLPAPYSAEIRFKVVPPIGYTLRTLPEAQSLVMGPASYTSRFKKRADDVVEATFTFTTGKRRMTAAEARDFVDGLRRAWDQPIVALQFDHRGSRHLAEGRFREGLTEYRHLVDLHRDSALHHSRMAEALLRAGLGGPARVEARRAVEIDGASAYAHYTLGWVLMHDLFGRPHSPGFAKDQAIEAFAKVKALDPDNYDARVHLAILYEHDEDGDRYQDQAGLALAITEYESLLREQKGGVEDNLLIALYWAGRFEDIIRWSRDLEATPVRDAMLLVAHVAKSGVAAGLEELADLGLSPEVRQKVIDTAATSLAHLRRYDEALALAGIAAQGADDMVASQGRLAMLSRLHRFEEHMLPETDPAHVVQKALDLLFMGAIDREALSGVLSDRLALDDDDSLRGMSEAFDQFHRTVRGSGVPMEMIRDNILAATRFTSEGDDRTGYRIKAVMAGPNGQKTSFWFVVRQKGGYRVRTSEATPPELAEEALFLLDRGDVRGARLWLDWAKEIVGQDSDEDPLTTSPFASLWKGLVPEPPSKDASYVRLAAASLAIMGRARDRAVETLERAEKKASTPGIELRVNQALVIAYLDARRFDDALRSAAKLRKRAASSDKAHDFQFRALLGLGRHDEARALAETRLASEAHDALALNELVDLATVAGDFGAAERHLRHLIERGLATPTTYNNLAWIMLFMPEVSSEAVDLALEANNMTRFANLSALHTLAALYAEQGKTREAFQLVLKRMELRSADEPEDVDWYLLGRIMEHYDLDDLATEAYQKVQIGERPSADSTFTLAKKRLALLQRKGKQG